MTSAVTLASYVY